MSRGPFHAWAGTLAAALAFAGCGTDGDTQGSAGAGGAPVSDAGQDSTLADATSDTGAGDAAPNDSALTDHAVGDGASGTDAEDATVTDTALDSASDGPLDSAGDATGDTASDGPLDSADDATGDTASDGPPDGADDATGDTASDGPTDAAQEAAVQDGAGADAPGSDEVWVEIDYTSAYTSQSPDWSFSATPGWGAAQWAMQGDTWPEAWDRWNNMVVENDPIGRSLTIGSGSELQLMIGLEELVGYDSMVVRLEGRSKATSSGVQFDVYNPLNGCGASGQMSQDWTPDVVELDLAQCAVVGAGIQAVRVSPTNGTIALLRMRVTIRGAVW